MLELITVLATVFANALLKFILNSICSLILYEV
jgi:hypothetical protein